MRRNRTELYFSNGTTDLVACVLHDQYPESGYDFEVEWVANLEGEQIPNGDMLYEDEIQREFEERLVNGLLQ